MFTYIVFSLHCTNEKLYFVRNHKVYLKSAESACEFSHVDFLLFNVSSFPRFILFRFLSLFLLFRCSTPTLFISCFSIMAENPLSLPSFYSPHIFSSSRLTILAITNGITIFFPSFQTVTWCRHSRTISLCHSTLHRSSYKPKNLKTNSLMCCSPSIHLKYFQFKLNLALAPQFISRALYIFNCWRRKHKSNGGCCWMCHYRVPSRWLAISERKVLGYAAGSI